MEYRHDRTGRSSLLGAGVGCRRGALCRPDGLFRGHATVSPAVADRDRNNAGAAALSLASRAPGRVLRDLHQQLAEVPALEQADEGLRRVLDALHDVLAVLDLARLQRGRHFLPEAVHLAEM